MGAGMLLFEDSAGVPGAQMKLQFQALLQLDDAQRESVRSAIAGNFQMHDAKR